MQIPQEQSIDLDLIQQNLIVVYANQYDNDSSGGVNNVVHCYIYENGEEHNIPANTTIWFKMKRPSGSIYSDTLLNIGGSYSGNCITFPINRDMTYLYGTCICNFQLINYSDVKNTCNFRLRVCKSPIQVDDVVDRSEYKDFDEKYKETQEQLKLLANEYVTNNSTPPSTADDNDFWTEFL